MLSHICKHTMIFYRTSTFCLRLLPALALMLTLPLSAQEKAKEHDHDHAGDKEHKHEEGNAKRAANTVILDEMGVKNLRIETVEAEEGEFEETIFALGRIEVLPGKKAIVSSRIPGRAFSVLALPDQAVDEGEELMWVESRQPGDPPPTVMLSAPIAGTIAKVDIAVGKPIDPGDSLIEIVNLDMVEAAARVPEHLAGKLAKDQVARIKVAGSDKIIEAKLAHLGAYADEESGTVEAAFHVPNEDHFLRPGMRAEFTIVVGTREGVTSVPREAVQGDPTSRFVYVKDFDLPNAFVKTPVVTGQHNGALVEITSGLFPADEVVTRGAYSLAFAGKGSLSLKEALDAAHGHEHNEDGSEKTATQKTAEGGDHGHEHGGGSSTLTKILIASNLLFAIMLVVQSMKKRSPQEAA